MSVRDREDAGRAGRPVNTRKMMLLVLGAIAVLLLIGIVISRVSDRAAQTAGVGGPTAGGRTGDTPGMSTDSTLAVPPPGPTTSPGAASGGVGVTGEGPGIAGGGMGGAHQSRPAAAGVPGGAGGTVSGTVPSGAGTPTRTGEGVVGTGAGTAPGLTTDGGAGTRGAGSAR